MDTIEIPKEEGETPNVLLPRKPLRIVQKDGHTLYMAEDQVMPGEAKKESK